MVSANDEGNELHGARSDLARPEVLLRQCDKQVAIE